MAQQQQQHAWRMHGSMHGNSSMHGAICMAGALEDWDGELVQVVNRQVRRTSRAALT